MGFLHFNREQGVEGRSPASSPLSDAVASDVQSLCDLRIGELLKGKQNDLSPKADLARGRAGTRELLQDLIDSFGEK